MPTPTEIEKQIKTRMFLRFAKAAYCEFNAINSDIYKEITNVKMPYNVYDTMDDIATWVDPDSDKDPREVARAVFGEIDELIRGE